MRPLLPYAVILAAAGCSLQEPTEGIFPTADVKAAAETDPVGTDGDAADDPAIWRNSDAPEKSLIIGTDKRAGVHVYDLSGKRVGFTPSPRLNNVDLRDGIIMAGETGILVAASDRQDEANAKIALFRLDPVARKLIPLATAPVGKGEAYGMCLWQRASDKMLFGFVITKQGQIIQIEFDLSGPTPQSKVVRSMKLASQSEGCVADDRTGLLYVAEEDAGIWRFDADPAGSVQAMPFVKVDGKTLFADAEGLAISAAGKTGGYLIASSQGDNAYAMYALPNGKLAGRFRISNGPTIDGTFETDGIELALGDFGPQFPDGLFVAQDGDNAPDTQNFKLVSWREILMAVSK
jgi:3-phytase